MMESHSKRLSDVVPHLPDLEPQREMMKLAQEEADRAEEIRHQVRLLRDHLSTGSQTEP
jgi:hypothetical protein